MTKFVRFLFNLPEILRSSKPEETVSGETFCLASCVIFNLGAEAARAMLKGPVWIETTPERFIAWQLHRRHNKLIGRFSILEVALLDVKHTKESFPTFTNIL